MHKIYNILTSTFSFTLIVHIFTEKKNKVNSIPVTEQQPVQVTIRDVEPIKGPPTVPPKQLIDINSDDNTPSWRKTLKQSITDSTNKSEFYCGGFCIIFEIRLCFKGIN